MSAYRDGNCTNAYEFLGAHPAADGSVQFAVWAPNAREVSVICDSNYWQHGQQTLLPSDEGIWRGKVKGLKLGDAYKFSLVNCWGHRIQKSDPYCFQAELRPRTASIVSQIDGYAWNDQKWISARDRANALEQPISVYEIHLGSWRRPRDGRQFFNYRELAHELVDYVNQMGYTHIELLPITEHPFDGSWGYQTIGYFAPTSRFGTPADFMYFIDFCHQNNIGVIVDWVPAHFPTDGHGLARFDGTCLYEHEDPRQGSHPDWGTLVFNFGRNEIRSFLLSSARFWCEKYHVDGLRVDAVASMLYLDYSRKPGEWVPNCYGGRENLEAIQFLKDLNTYMHRDFPGILMMAEESTAWGGVSRPVYTGGLGFSIKWDMGWMNDSLHYFRRETIHRKYHQNELSFRMVYAFTENFILPLSHDEVVHGKRSLLSQMPGDDWQKFANLRLLMAYQYAMPGKKLLFMGGEIGQWHEWQHDGELDWALLEFPLHQGLQKLVTDLNQLYRKTPSIHEREFTPESFGWIQCDDCDNSVFAFYRKGKNPKDYLVLAFNFTQVPRNGYRIGVPLPAFYREVLNTDASIYGGENVGNCGGLYSEPIPMHGHPQSLNLTIPPLGALFLHPVVASPVAAPINVGATGSASVSLLGETGGSRPSAASKGTGAKPK